MIVPNDDEAVPATLSEDILRRAYEKFTNTTPEGVPVTLIATSEWNREYLNKNAWDILFDLRYKALSDGYEIKKALLGRRAYASIRYFMLSAHSWIQTDTEIVTALGIPIEVKDDYAEDRIKLIVRRRKV